MNTIKNYSATGFVYGQLWDGEKGGYPAQSIEANSREELDHKINAALSDKSLDSGMGFQHLIGALMFIEETETIEVNNKQYSRSETNSVVYGKIEEDALVYLNEIAFECY